jgi:hypothetical protein
MKMVWHNNCGRLQAIAGDSLRGLAGEASLAPTRNGRRGVFSERFQGLRGHFVAASYCRSPSQEGYGSRDIMRQSLLKFYATD